MLRGRPKPAGVRARFAAAAYALPVSRGVSLRLAIAIRRTAATRSVICRTLWPSGKTMCRRGEGAAA
jgi:hypothetical protein